MSRQCLCVETISGAARRRVQPAQKSRMRSVLLITQRLISIRGCRRRPHRCWQVLQSYRPKYDLHIERNLHKLVVGGTKCNATYSAPQVTDAEDKASSPM